MRYGTSLADDPDRSKPAKKSGSPPRPSTINDKTIADFTRVVERAENAAFRTVRSLPT
jgi:hypothetical protein